MTPIVLRSPDNTENGSSSISNNESQIQLVLSNVKIVVSGSIKEDVTPKTATLYDFTVGVQNEGNNIEVPFYIVCQLQGLNSNSQIVITKYQRLQYLAAGEKITITLPSGTISEAGSYSLQAIANYSKDNFATPIAAGPASDFIVSKNMNGNVPEPKIYNKFSKLLLALKKNKVIVYGIIISILALALFYPFIIHKSEGLTNPPPLVVIDSPAPVQTPDVKPDNWMTTEMLSGTWNNENSNTRGIVKLEVHANGSTANVQVWGACSPTPCDWGKQNGNIFFENVENNQNENFVSAKIVYNQSFANSTLIIKPIAHNRIEVECSTEFIDGSGRNNFSTKDNYIKQ